jgi:hypothetical protein
VIKTARIPFIWDDGFNPTQIRAEPKRTNGLLVMASDRPPQEQKKELQVLVQEDVKVRFAL